jgi:protein TonB
MEQDRIQNKSFLLSFAIHVGVTLSLLLINFSVNHVEPEYVTIGFGGLGNLSSSGKQAESEKEEKEKSELKAEENVKLPKALNQEDENILPKSDDKKNRFDESIKSLSEENKNSNKGREFYGEGSGKFGFDIDFGGQGIRKIYNYSLPKYPDGVFKEIDVKLKFTILSDGTVGNIIPLIKADTRLEEAAIKSLRQWRFEPLAKNQKSTEQVAVIIFPFRLE